jgi:hypothetical protein
MLSENQENENGPLRFKNIKSPLKGTGLNDADHLEGKATKAIEKQTSRIPSGVYLALAVGSMVISAALVTSKRKELGNFVGLWAPSILILGLYNKIVKTQGSDAKTRA